MAQIKIVFTSGYKSDTMKTENQIKERNGNNRAITGD